MSFTETQSRFRFGRASRLLKPSEFQAVFDARQACRGQWITIHRFQQGQSRVNPVDGHPEAVEITDPPPRLGLIVAKRLVASSARRNLIRRVLREYFRISPSEFPPGDWIIRLHESPFRVKKNETSRSRIQVVTALRSDVTQVLNRIAGQIRKEGRSRLV